MIYTSLVSCQARLPGKEWRERHGAAGVPSDERRGSPIVELSLLLVRPACALKNDLPMARRCQSITLTSSCAGMVVQGRECAMQAECVQHGLRTIAFCNTRKLCELVTAYTRETLESTAPDLASTISVYRAGYSPQVPLACPQSLLTAALLNVEFWKIHNNLIRLQGCIASALEGRLGRAGNMGVRESPLVPGTARD